MRLIYDWMGALGVGTRRVLQPLVEAGGVVRCFNKPHFDSPFGWLTRDHRKMIAVDGHVGYVSGLCVSSKWQGQSAARRRPVARYRHRNPRSGGRRHRACICPDLGWRPATDALDVARRRRAPPAGDVLVRVLASQPNFAGLYRLDQMIAAMARETLWLTDAYFVGIAPYVQALRAAAHDGVDVRLLVPGTSDLPLLGQLSRSGYRPLLEAGIRVFEWNGAMLHAKTAVADGRWARVGSTNLNIASWISNYELDVAIEDEGCARCMQDMYEEDLRNATEIVLGAKRRVRRSAMTARHSAAGSGGRAARAAAGALRIGNTVGAAFSNRRMLGPAESGIDVQRRTGLSAVRRELRCWCRWRLTVPLALLALWIAVTLAGAGLADAQRRCRGRAGSGRRLARQRGRAGSDCGAARDGSQRPCAAMLRPL